MMDRTIGHENLRLVAWTIVDRRNQPYDWSQQVVQMISSYGDFISGEHGAGCLPYKHRIITS